MISTVLLNRGPYQPFVQRSQGRQTYSQESVFQSPIITHWLCTLMAAQAVAKVAAAIFAVGACAFYDHIKSQKAEVGELRKGQKKAEDRATQKENEAVETIRQVKREAERAERRREEQAKAAEEKRELEHVEAERR